MWVAHVYIDKKAGEKREQSVFDHLNGTAKYAERFATSFGEALCGKNIGLTHDIGKYSNDFQKRIEGAKISVDHSTAGARMISEQQTPLGLLAAYCVMGHHGGLPDGGSKSQHQSFPGTFYYRLTDSEIPDYSAYSSEVDINLPNAPQTWTPELNNMGFSLAFLTRMLFSCLVDADWLDTEWFMKNGAVERGGFEPIEVLFNRLSRHIKKLDAPKKDNSKIDINKKRKQLRSDCSVCRQSHPFWVTFCCKYGIIER